MKKTVSYGCLLLLLIMSACSKQVNKRITFWRNDKIPYGGYYAYHNLQYVFPDADIISSGKSPYTFYQDDDSAAAYIILSYNIQPDENELNAMLNYAMSGNHVFISGIRIGENLLDSFNLKSTSFPTYIFAGDTLKVSLGSSNSRGFREYSYPGYALGNHFTEMDSNVTQVLGRDEEGNANFVRFRYQGGGSVFFHLAPAAFSNFFLLHRDNKEYYDRAMSAIPDSVKLVRWDDYFRRHTNGKNNAERSAFSKLGTFLNNEVLRWAFWLTILLFAIMYLVESKRKQRVIPSIPKLNNSSLDFVKTVGRLYYQRKDNKNLAQKIAAHFLGHIRSRYNLSTSQLDEKFEERLAYKSGRPLLTVREVMEEVRSLELAYDMSDEELLAFNDKIDKFINKP